jgi:hypothetical protein
MVESCRPIVRTRMIFFFGDFVWHAHVRRLTFHRLLLLLLHFSKGENKHLTRIVTRREITRTNNKYSVSFDATVEHGKPLTSC